MAKRMPSLLALLGLVAVAGYQNREKIGEFVKGLSNDPNGPAGGMIDMAKKAIGNSPTATSITGGLGELVEQFTKGGEGKTAESWIGTGPNRADLRIANGKDPGLRSRRQPGQADRPQPRGASPAPGKNPARGR